MFKKFVWFPDPQQTNDPHLCCDGAMLMKIFKQVQQRGVVLRAVWMLYPSNQQLYPRMMGWIVAMETQDMITVTQKAEPKMRWLDV